MPDRNPIVAGTFYPGNSATLHKVVLELLRKPHGSATGSPTAHHPLISPELAASEHPVDALMVMLPHAGYVYSGRVAGATLAQANLPKVIFLLGPNHTGHGASIAVWPKGHWLTPLGPVPVHEAASQALVDSGAGFTANRIAHEGEHSLEVLLPLLQVSVPDLSIVPVTVAERSPTILAQAGAALAAVMLGLQRSGVASAIVLSSDMSHYVSQAQAERLDSLALDKVRALDPDGLYATVRSNNITMCGVLPAIIALHACRAMGSTEALLAEYDTSGTASGDHAHVVGYAGMIVPRAKK